MNIPNLENAQIRFFDSIYRHCVEKCRIENNAYSISMLKMLNNGTAVLSDETECDWYIAFYGGHHFYKLNAAFDSTNFRYTEGKDLEIIDWGCGQALATCVLIDYLIENSIKPNIVSITLIEPSSIALNRGCRFIQQMFQNYFSMNTTIRVVNKYIDDLNTSDLPSHTDTIKIHLFSNLIDVEAFNIDGLYQLIVNSFKGLNRLICTSPDNYRLNRLDQFYNLFKESCDVRNSVQSDQEIYKEIFYFKTRKYERRRIGRCERQFSVNLA
ncbi:hypothetical protein PN492_10225 [Dolichospermum circinale CS-537/01]|uniref:Methyltransferase domain-containing protein n=1 Tax=Dolichospermum circinale CS-537/01 TaxID=3021739 RepID=A0ABT5A4T3_9CYAN|nr:hypothetical protein [Dolichospermum circinale]MDB9486914.1 hypothetical protein [Dolichospermum circinale CS-537/01]